MNDCHIRIQRSGLNFTFYITLHSFTLQLILLFCYGLMLPWNRPRPFFFISFSFSPPPSPPSGKRQYSNADSHFPACNTRNFRQHLHWVSM